MKLPGWLERMVSSVRRRVAAEKDQPWQNRHARRRDAAIARRRLRAAKRIAWLLGRDKFTARDVYALQKRGAITRDQAAMFGGTR